MEIKKKSPQKPEKIEKNNPTGGEGLPLTVCCQ